MKLKKILLKGVLFGFGVVSLWSHAAVTIGPNTTITFESGKAILTPDSENKIRELLKEARDSGKIDEVKVAVWSDNPTPREGEELSKTDRELAKARVKAIENSLKLHKVSDVESYNMAERASWLSRVFNTDAAGFKSETGRGKDSPMFKEEFQIFKENGSPSKAVIVSLVKHHK
jgi:hypothetical protein